MHIYVYIYHPTFLKPKKCLAQSRVFWFDFFVVWCLGSSVLYDSSDAVGIRSKYSEKVDEGYTNRLQDGAINLRMDTLQAQTEATSS